MPSDFIFSYFFFMIELYTLFFSFCCESLFISGTIQCFFGSLFMTIFHLREVIDSYPDHFYPYLDTGKQIWKNYHTFRKCSHNNEITKLKIFLYSLDSIFITDQFIGMNVSFFTLLTSFKIKFTHSITLGNSFYNTIEPFIIPSITDYLIYKIPEPLQKWIPYLLKYTQRIVL